MSDSLLGSRSPSKDCASPDACPTPASPDACQHLILPFGETQCRFVLPRARLKLTRLARI
jgi:hypothetical protein